MFFPPVTNSPPTDLVSSVQSQGGGHGSGQFMIFTPEMLPPTPKRQSSRILRVAKGFLFVIGTLQLLLAFTAVCVFFARLEDQGPYFASLATSVLFSNAVLGVCGGLGLVAASGRSRVLICVLLTASLFLIAMSSILIDNLVSWCKKYYLDYGFSPTVVCGSIPPSRTYDHPTVQSQSQTYTTSVYDLLLANEALILAFAVLAAAGTLLLLCVSCSNRNTDQ